VHLVTALYQPSGKPLGELRGAVDVGRERIAADDHAQRSVG
jgi:hypothetical protein